MKRTLNIIQFMPYFPPHKGGLETVWKEIWENWVKSWFWEVVNVITSFEQEGNLKDFEKKGSWHFNDFGIHQNDTTSIIFDWKIIWYKKNWVVNLVIPSWEIVNNFPVYKFLSKKKNLVFKYLETSLNSPLVRGDEATITVVLTHTRFFLTSLFWWIFARKNKLKWIHIEHWSDYVKLSSKFKSYIAYLYDRIIWKWIFKKANKLLAISEASKNFIEKVSRKEKVEVFYRWLDIKKYDWIKSWNIKLVFVWRLVALKWVDDLVEVYKNSKIKSKLIIIWDWEERENLQEKSKWYNIAFLWSKDRNFIIDFLYKNNVILVNPSFQEWLPTVVIEWLLTRNIVVASDVGGTKEISNKKDLILFKAWDKEDLEEKLKYALDNFENLAWISEKFVREKFSWEGNINKLYEFIK
jgi:hypothetical protein